jgi:hypothetical protein
MTDSHMITGLRAKYAEISGHILRTREYLDRLTRDLLAIEAALRVVDPDMDAERASLSPVPIEPRAGRGEVSRVVLGYLREMPGATSRDLALRLMADRGLNTGDRRLVRTMVRRVGAVLYQCRKRGLIK